ncbi:unnamed protein product [Linum tenue]|uniref:Uncharacterized protein n=1 Tax=Linum tenue TaxID=586396 RepID=A0AAV0MNG9_9ROSI|nr:unnamed protein product [Linum tenue]
MPIALQRQGSMPEIQRRRATELGIGGAAFVPASAMLPRNKDVAAEEGSDREHSPSPSSSSTSSSSSIGNDSDDCEGREEEAENEVESSFRGPTILDLGALERSLTGSDWRKGLSRCYVGKAKSFSDLGEAESITDISELEKTEHAVNKRRRSEIALAHVWDRSGGATISKRSITSSASAISLTLTMAAAMGEGCGGAVGENRSHNFRNHRLHHHHHHHHPKHLPPLHPGGSSSHMVVEALQSPKQQQQQRSSPMRSFSMADLHYFAPAPTTNSH